MTFDLDGNTTSQTYFTQGSNEGMHYIYYQNDPIPEGNHTLIATIQHASGDISAYIDYITYKPSFSTLTDKPVFQDIPDPNGTTTSNIPISSSKNTPATAIIVGATVGGILVLGGMIAAGLWLLRKKQQKRKLHINSRRSDNS